MDLIGIGVGNLAHDAVEGIVLAAVESGLTWIDTAHKSENEHLIRRGLSGHRAQVLTKVWYTHLGARRTRIALEDSMGDLGSPTLNAVLLHWPRCRQDIPWMKCAAEERRLPVSVQTA